MILAAIIVAIWAILIAALCIVANRLERHVHAIEAAARQQRHHTTDAGSEGLGE